MEDDRGDIDRHADVAANSGGVAADLSVMDAQHTQAVVVHTVVFVHELAHQEVAVVRCLIAVYHWAPALVESLAFLHHYLNYHHYFEGLEIRVYCHFALIYEHAPQVD